MHFCPFKIYNSKTNNWPQTITFYDISPWIRYCDSFNDISSKRFVKTNFSSTSENDSSLKNVLFSSGHLSQGGSCASWNTCLPHLYACGCVLPLLLCSASCWSVCWEVTGDSDSRFSVCQSWLEFLALASAELALAVGSIWKVNQLTGDLCVSVSALQIIKI